MADKKVNLENYSKKDLIRIIERMSAFGQGWYLANALRELHYQKDIQRIDEADRIAKLSAAKRREYIDLLSPYDGKPFREIPMSVCEKAAKAMEEAQKLDAQWNKLMGIKKREN